MPIEIYDQSSEVHESNGYLVSALRDIRTADGLMFVRALFATHEAIVFAPTMSAWIADAVSCELAARGNVRTTCGVLRLHEISNAELAGTISVTAVFPVLVVQHSTPDVLDAIVRINRLLACEAGSRLIRSKVVSVGGVMPSDHASDEPKFPAQTHGDRE